MHEPPDGAELRVTFRLSSGARMPLCLASCVTEFTLCLTEALCFAAFLLGSSPICVRASTFTPSKASLKISYGVKLQD
jgi:hypothetical protein